MLLGEVSDFYCMIWFLRGPYKKIKIISDRIFFTVSSADTKKAG